MADDCFRWLDQDSAEKLLCGEPVEAPDECARGQADRLSAALADLAAVAYANDLELPGEADALAAFRQVRDASDPERNAALTVSGAVSEAVSETISETAADTSPGRKHPGRVPRIATVVRLIRPVRLAAVTAVAGCAIGGAAMALGVVALPMPFDGTHHAYPGESAITAPTPRPPAAAGDPGGPGRTGNGRGPGATALAPFLTGGWGKGPGPFVVPNGAPGAGTPDGGAGLDLTGGGGTAGDGLNGVGSEASGRATSSGAGVLGGPGGTAALFPPQSDQDMLEACEQHRNGTTDPREEATLEAAAHGPGRVERFCDRLLDPGGSAAKEDPSTSPTVGRGGGKAPDGPDGIDGGDSSGDGAPSPTPSAPPTIPVESPVVPDPSVPSPGTTQGTTPVPAPGRGPGNTVSQLSPGDSPTA